MPLLFKHAYPAEVWEGIMMVIALAERDRPIRNNARELTVGGNVYELGLNDGRDRVWVRCMKGAVDRRIMENNMERWNDALRQLTIDSEVKVPDSHPNKAIIRDNAKMARFKLKDIQKLMAQTQQILDKPVDVTFEQHPIRELTGFQLAVMTVLNGEPSDADLRVPEPENRRVERTIPLNPVVRAKPKPRVKKPTKADARKRQLAKNARKRADNILRLGKNGKADVRVGAGGAADAKGARGESATVAPGTNDQGVPGGVPAQEAGTQAG